MKPVVFIIDVDGILTDGKMYYSKDGKVMKVFGPDDHDAISLLKPFVETQFVTGDKRGFSISSARIVEDMKMPLTLVSTIKRIDWIKERWDHKRVIYMGDGIFDHYVFKNVGYSISTVDSDEYAKTQANFITKRKGSERALSEACLHILEKFFVPYNPDCLPEKQAILCGEWTI